MNTEVRKLVEEMADLASNIEFLREYSSEEFGWHYKAIEEAEERLAEIEEILEEYEMGEWIEYDQ